VFDLILKLQNSKTLTLLSIL